MLLKWIKLPLARPCNLPSVGWVKIRFVVAMFMVCLMGVFKFRYANTTRQELNILKAPQIQRATALMECLPECDPIVLGT
jgi:flavin reductase (DIM6/NTAB) family NADH-FMN oxidoreductase RutF